jgi:hypothetical protein
MRIKADHFVLLCLHFGAQQVSRHNAGLGKTKHRNRDAQDFFVVGRLILGYIYLACPACLSACAKLRNLAGCFQHLDFKPCSGSVLLDSCFFCFFLRFDSTTSRPGLILRCSSQHEECPQQHKKLSCTVLRVRHDFQEPRIFLRIPGIPMNESLRGFYTAVNSGRKKAFSGQV